MSSANKKEEVGIYQPGIFLISWMGAEYLHYVQRIKWVALYGPHTKTKRA